MPDALPSQPPPRAANVTDLLRTPVTLGVVLWIQALSMGLVGAILLVLARA